MNWLSQKGRKILLYINIIQVNELEYLVTYAKKKTMREVWIVYCLGVMIFYKWEMFIEIYLSIASIYEQFCK